MKPNPVFQKMKHSIRFSFYKDAEFKKQLIHENSKRLFLLLGFVTMSQLLFAVLELSGFLEWEKSILVSRVIVTCACLIFMISIYIARKNISKKSSRKVLGVLITVIQFLIVLAGCYFVVYMFDKGVYSLSAFILVSFVVSLTCVRNPYTAGLIISAFFAELTLYISFYKVEFIVWQGEFIIALIYLFLLYIGNVLNYNRYLKLFLQDIEMNKVNDKLKAMSQIDELTGIYNHRKLTELLKDYVALSKRYQTPFCVSVIDLDHFKEINDKYGHIVGDDVLHRFSDNVRFMLRSIDVFGRWGGEEFVIIIPSCRESEAYLLLDRLRRSIESYPFPTAGRVTFSAGISAYNGEEDFSEVIKKADIALYMAKKARNQVCIYQAAYQKLDAE